MKWDKFTVLLGHIQRILFCPYPLRILVLRQLVKRLSFVSYKRRLLYEALPRPHYGHCIYNAAKLAESLGYKTISIIEFGVAEGDGLLKIEYHIKEIKKTANLDFEIYGFDLGSGLPNPQGYQDLPYYWGEGFYSMDFEKLETRLRFSKLIIGDIEQTVTDFFDKYSPAPIGCVLFDVDYFSSTISAFRIFDTIPINYLPRVFCYFDDVVGNEVGLYSEYTGELLAINEFNAKNPFKKIAKIRYKPHVGPFNYWYDKIYIFHDFKHPAYNQFVRH